MGHVEEDERGYLGRIELIFGPMFSGKTTKLLDRLHYYQTEHKHSCVLIKFDPSKEENSDLYSFEALSFGHDDYVETHDGMKHKAISTYYLSDLDHALILNRMHAIFLDEAQFFPDVCEFARSHADSGKIVVLAALDADYRREPFDIVQLVPHAECVEKLRKLCSDCKESRYGSFSKRMVSETKQMLLGGDETYITLCRKCYDKTHCTKCYERGVIHSVLS